MKEMFSKMQVASAVIVIAAAGPFVPAQAERVDMERLIVQGDQGPLSVVRMGVQGLPVLFLHADPGNSAQWIGVMTALSANHRVVAYDARGAGASAPAANGDYSFAGRAMDLEKVVDALAFDRFVIVAHSGGAAVAMAYAELHAERVTGLFLLDPPGDPSGVSSTNWVQTIEALGESGGEAMFLGYVGSIAGTDDEVIAQVVSDARKITPAARAGMTAAVSQWNPEHAFSAIDEPIFVLTTPDNSSLAELGNLTDAEHGVSNTGGHWIQLDDPTLVIESLNRFLGRIGADG